MYFLLFLKVYLPRVYKVYRNTSGNLGEAQNSRNLANSTQSLVPPIFPRVFL